MSEGKLNKGRIEKVLIAFLFTALLVGCAAHQSLEPVGKDQVQWNASLGGPIVEAFGTHIFIPYTDVGARMGLRNDLDISGSIHLLPVAYGILGADFYSTWYPILNHGWVPTIGLQAGALFFASIKADVEERFRAFPVLSESFKWQFGRHDFYAGSNLAIIVPSPKYNQNSEPIILSPFMGARWNLGSRFSLLTELKWNAANFETDKIAVTPISISNRGDLTPLLMLEWGGSK